MVEHVESRGAGLLWLSLTPPLSHAHTSDIGSIGMAALRTHLLYNLWSDTIGIDMIGQALSCGRFLPKGAKRLATRSSKIHRSSKVPRFPTVQELHHLGYR